MLRGMTFQILARCNASNMSTGATKCRIKHISASLEGCSQQEKQAHLECSSIYKLEGQDGSACFHQAVASGATFSWVWCLPLEQDGLWMQQWHMWRNSQLVRQTGLEGSSHDKLRDRMAAPSSTRQWLFGGMEPGVMPPCQHYSRSMSQKTHPSIVGAMATLPEAGLPGRRLP